MSGTGLINFLLLMCASMTVIVGIFTHLLFPGTGVVCF
jgi:hypothetical protein